MSVQAAGPMAHETDASNSLTAEKSSIPLSSWLSVAAMLLASIYATVDRQIFILFAEAIRQDLQLSDTQLGTLQGVGLSLVGLITVYPISAIADRYDRRKVIASCVILWSAAVLGCGLSPGFAWLLLFTSLVGIGEAGVGPAGFAIIPDLFPKSARQLANAIFAIGFRLATSLGVYVAGLLIVMAEWIRPHLPAGLADLAEWRLSFLLTVLFAPIAAACLLFLPKRAAGSPTVKETLPETASLEGVWSFMKRHRAAWSVTMTAALLMAFGSVAVAGWAPVVAQRYFGQTPLESGEWLASMGLISGLAGFAIGTPILQRLQAKYGLRTPIYAIAGSLLLQSLCALGMALARNAPQLYILWGIQATIGMIATMVVPTILQNMAPIHLRARIFAVSTFVGMAGSLSYVGVGFLSDKLQGAVQYPLLYAASGLGFIGLFMGALVFWKAQTLYVAVATETNS